MSAALCFLHPLKLQNNSYIETTLVACHPQSVVEEQSLAPDERIVANVGKTDAKKHLAMDVSSLMAANIIQVWYERVKGRA